MIALDINVLTVVFQNNFSAPFQGIRFPGQFSFDSCWVLGMVFLQEVERGFQRKTLAVARQLLNETRSVANP